MKCRSPSPPAVASVIGTNNTVASPTIGSRRVSSNNSKRRSSASSIKLLGSIGRVESNSSLSRAGGASATSNHTSATPSQSLMQPLLDDDFSSSSPQIGNSNSNTATSVINQRDTKAAMKSNANVKQQIDKTETDPLNLGHRRKLPRPLPPSKCPLLCVFYAEFDNVIGPTVTFQSPNKFMHFDVSVGPEEIYQALKETFQSVNNSQTRGEMKQNAVNSDDYWNTAKNTSSDNYWNWSPTKNSVDSDIDQASQVTIPMSIPLDVKKNFGEATSDSVHHDGSNIHANSSSVKESTTNDGLQSVSDDVPAQSIRHHRSPSYASSSKGTMMSIPTNHEGDTSTIDTELLSNSIFAATSEYIITGNELANQTLTVSTHGMHILSKPMIICDTERYERNSHLFAVGFVLRRNSDPRPYWPLLSNISFTLRDMEVESEFLTNELTRPQIQHLLEDILLSLNSRQRDCHLLLDDANLLNLRLFRPPPPPTPPVSDYVVPILLRPLIQVHMFDWDLTINWILPHIDGVKYLKQIALSSEVDLELVHACLRVLRHHGVLAHVDIFRYSNVYESTPLGKELLNTKEGDDLLLEAYIYAAKSKKLQKTKVRTNRLGSDMSPTVMSTSPFTLTASGRLHSNMNSINSIELSANGGSNSLGWSSAVTGWAKRMEESSSHHTIAEEDESDDEKMPPKDLSNSDGAVGTNMKRPNDAAFKEIEPMKNALAQLYASCDRSRSFGEILVEKVSMGTVTSTKKTSTSVQSETIEWKTIFEYFDHRRLVTFGVVRGLIKRVHRYPLAYEIGGKSSGAEGSCGDHIDVHSDMAASDPSEFDFNSQRKTSFADSLDISVVAAEAATTAKNFLDDGSRSSYPVSPLLQGISALPFERHPKKKQTKKKPSSEAMALAMNGMRCDDELSCMFDAPVEKLVEKVEKTGKWNVISVFSCTK